MVAPSQQAADELVRPLVLNRGARFGVHRLTFNRLISLLGMEDTARRGLTYVDGLGAQAVAARALYALRGDPALAPLGAVAGMPGLPKAIAVTWRDLSHARVEPRQIAATGPLGPALARIFEEYRTQLEAARLIDRAGVIEAALAAVKKVSQFTGLPLLLLDVTIESAMERELVSALAGRAPEVLATAADNRARSSGGIRARNLELMEAALETRARRFSGKPARNALERVQENLFAGDAPSGKLDESLSLYSAAGEMQECVEIARQIQAAARGGVRFDQIAIVLRNPARYIDHLQEALSRAGIPSWFARGTLRPEPGGRALLALLECLAEQYSARRFAEYLALGQVPTPDTAADEAGEASAAGADPEMLSAAAGAPLAIADPPETDPAPDAAAGRSRAPWRWERLLLQASVVGGRERWRRRLDGLRAELELRRGELEEDDARATRLDRELRDLAHLRAIALPIIESLAALPKIATWADWLIGVRGLAALAIREKQAVLAALVELEPMGPVSGITLDEVRIVLQERLGRLEAPPAPRRYGAVCITSTDGIGGLEFDLVLTPGLAERLFPQKVSEDPLLSDAQRKALSSELPTQAERAGKERMALMAALGAARERAALSYPRVDVERGRPLVPSFYALEVMQAAEGKLPGFDELARRATGERRVRLGWPAPEEPQAAIDEIEFDLAILERVLDDDPEVTRGAAHYLLDANKHLGRALRARARRWRRLWTPNDGLVNPTVEQRAALERHQLVARSYSPTGLQNYAACPYRFYLQAILRLAPREDLEAIEAIDPLTRGALFHEVQFETLTALRAAGLLPLKADGLESAYATLDGHLTAIAARYQDELAPAIARVWQDGIESIRADLREWMRRMTTAHDGFNPARFELSFGLVERAQADPASVVEAIEVANGLRLRGSIDLVESASGGVLRVTDHKTGKVRADKNVVIGGGKTLQPVLYALAAEKILRQTVAGGRLYYCTAAGNYEERVTPLDAAAREAAAFLISTIGEALDTGFLPAAPGERECDFCDYRLVCGPYEQRRFQLKRETAGAQAKLLPLTRLRELL